MNANFSELHSRLNHLVNYSSQLIFVSSESIAEQHRTLEAFMADQDEQTEVAFISALNDGQVISYRRQLCQQLIGQVAGSFVRPLNELLVSLNHHDGPVLIGITQAHHLPNSFLQELWDLVLQSRFASNKQHLNIVLFGDSQWAEDAQAWLPAKNTATPLLLSSESIETVETELEQLISQKRAAFQQRLANRYQNEDDNGNHTSLIKRPWFSIVIIACFIVFFGGILSWQYPDKMASLLGFSNATTQQESEAMVELPVVTEVDNTSVSDVIESAPNIESTSSSVTEELLVTKWQADEMPATDTREQLTKPTVEKVKDKSTDDIEGLTGVPELNDSQYLIQMAGLKDLGLAKQYLSDQNLIDSVWIYKTERYGGDWFVIVHNQVFNSFSEAQSNIANLPDYQSQSEPFVKASAQINTELKR